MFVGFCVALMVSTGDPDAAQHHPLLARDDRRAARRRRDLRRGRAGRLSRDERPGEGRRSVPRRLDPVLQRRDDVPTQVALRRLRGAGAVDPADHHRGVGLRALQRGQPHRRARRPGRRHRRDRLGHALSLRTAPGGPRTPAEQQRGTAHRGPDVRHLSGVPARQLPSGEALHGRRRRVDAGPSDERLDDGDRGAHAAGERRDVLLLRARC